MSFFRQALCTELQQKEKKKEGKRTGMRSSGKMLEANMAVPVQWKPSVIPRVGRAPRCRREATGTDSISLCSLFSATSSRAYTDFVI